MLRGQRNADGGRQQRAGPVGMLVRGLATGIGLATESYQYHKEKKASKTAAGNDAEEDAAGANGELGLEDEAHLSHQMDEAVWELDEAQDQLAGHEPDGEDQRGQLALPVVITQRRPGSRTRGFVHAYSPLLADVGIDQATFLHFLDNLNKSVEPSPWIQAINLASFAGHAVPEPFTMIISMAVKRVADASSELHSRSKTNKFLDQVNESFFAPEDWSL
ncbi:heterokaryon incompatibility protein-domain-containing protein [Apiospora hydei]|uniref:Heterokaryon incompatibility protein-domain-containing protein n=1 Tax=Apiospora hydei TaxID=1337664 RepID=A0ABR1X9R5_9PEZI